MTPESNKEWITIPDAFRQTMIRGVNVGGDKHYEHYRFWVDADPDGTLQTQLDRIERKVNTILEVLGYRERITE